MAQMTVQVVTPDGLKYDHHASFIHAVTKDGQIGILPGHINLIAPLEVKSSRFVVWMTRVTSIGLP